MNEAMHRAIDPYKFSKSGFNPEVLYPYSSAFMKLALANLHQVAANHLQSYQTVLVNSSKRPDTLLDLEQNHPQINWYTTIGRIRFALDQMPIAYLAYIVKDYVHFPTDIMGRINTAAITPVVDPDPKLTPIDEIPFHQILYFFARTNNLRVPNVEFSKLQDKEALQKYKLRVGDEYFAKYNHYPWFVGYCTSSLNVEVTDVTDSLSTVLPEPLKGCIHINSLGIIEPVLDENIQNHGFKLNIFMTPVKTWDLASYQWIQSYTESMGKLCTAQGLRRPTNDEIVRDAFGIKLL